MQRTDAQGRIEFPLRLLGAEDAVRAPNFRYLLHDSLLEWVQRSRKQSVPPLQNPRRVSSPESHKIPSPHPWHKMLSKYPYQIPSPFFCKIPSPQSHTISSTRSWTTSPATQTFDLSAHALSYPNHGFNRASATYSAPLPSLQPMHTNGSRRSRCKKQVPPTT